MIFKNANYSKLASEQLDKIEPKILELVPDLEALNDTIASLIELKKALENAQNIMF